MSRRRRSRIDELEELVDLWEANKKRRQEGEAPVGEPLPKPSAEMAAATEVNWLREQAVIVMKQARDDAMHWLDLAKHLRAKAAELEDEAAKREQFVTESEAEGEHSCDSARTNAGGESATCRPQADEGGRANATPHHRGGG
jgi:hypothetical protein